MTAQWIANKAAGVVSQLGTHRRRMSIVIYLATSIFALTGAYLLRFDFVIPERQYANLPFALAVVITVRLGLVKVFRLSRGRWRFISTTDVLRLAAATILGTAIIGAALSLLPLSPRVPRSVVLLEGILNCLLTCGVWLGYRTAFESIRHLRFTRTNELRRVIIVGAGDAGHLLAREMLRSPTGYRPVAFVDDDQTKHHVTLHGINVVGDVESLPRVAAQYQASEIILAVPSATPQELQRLVDICAETELPFKVLPGIAQVLAGDVKLTQLREVQIEDLLGREPVTLDLPELAEDLRGQSVLITGAAGSIGSELSRQVALHDPAILILMDQAETDLFYLEHDLRAKFADLVIYPVVGDIVHEPTVRRVFDTWAPSRVFHAAAYKHVPMMEANPVEAVRNNIIGTWRVAHAAGRYNAAKFVLVSTDKAVRPRNVMGATKRLAELAILDLQKEFPQTAYSAVRFGNVLGSNGSVIPLFRRQLAEGLPLTVTHPDATRYFMTIPEAVQLILHASLLPDLRGNIALLEMGEPVRIAQLAEKLLKLSGEYITRDRIVYTGLRPGEKLHEELVAPEELLLTTSIPKVRIIVEREESKMDVRRLMLQWESAITEGRGTAVLRQMAPLFPDMVGSLEAEIEPIQVVGT